MQLIKNFIETIRLFQIIIQKFIHAPCSSKYFMFFVYVIHVHVVFIWHNFLIISFIIRLNLMNLSSKQFVYVQLSSKKFIDVQTFHPFLTFIHVHVEKYFPCHSYVTHRDFLRIFCPCHQNIPNIFVIAHKLMLMFTCLLPSVVVFEIIHVLINFAPKKKVFVCDYIVAIKIY